MTFQRQYNIHRMNLALVRLSGAYVRGRIGETLGLPGGGLAVQVMTHEPRSYYVKLIE